MRIFPAFALLFVQSLPNASRKLTSDRFVKFNEDDIKSSSEEHENVNNMKNSSYDLKSFKDLLASKDERGELQETPATQLEQLARKLSFTLLST